MRDNPRTSSRAIPAGQLSVAFVWVFTAVATSVFLIAAAMLNRLTLDSRAPRVGEYLVVFVFQEMDFAVTRFARMVSCHRTYRRLDRRTRRDR